MSFQQQFKVFTQSNQSKTDFFKSIDVFIKNIDAQLKKGEIGEKEIQAINQSFSEEFLNETLQGYCFRKPFGYAGDFLIIDKIYTYQKSDNPKYRIWDEYFQQQAAPKAVRNRKTYFKETLKTIISKKQNVNLLNVASGPARDLFELYESIDSKSLQTTCVEMDKNAIEYATKLNQSHLSQIEFINKNIFRYQTQEKYDVIWSAGLFDYFNDKAFVMMLKRFKEWLKEGGEIIIGNFNENHNPSRPYMEIFGQWLLHHRTPEQLSDLAQAAGYSKNQIRVGRELENVNLFLHLKTD